MADKTVKIAVDSSEAGKFQSDFRRDAEQLARDMIRSSRQYSTSSKEVLKDIEDQIRAIEKRNKLDAEFRRIRLESLRERGDVSGSQYTQASRGLINEYREDQTQTRLLREIVEAIVKTSKDEIREDRATVEKTIRESRTIGQLGVSGDELKSLKETVQAGAIGNVQMNELQQRAGLNMAKYANIAMSTGGMLGAGDVSGLAMMGSRGLMGAMGGVGTAGAIGLGAGAGVLALLAGSFFSNKQLGEQTRNYMLATQTGFGGIGSHINRFRDQNFSDVNMTSIEAMDFYSNMLRSSGGRGFDLGQAKGYIGLTRSRDVSPELLNSIISSQRYSTGGDAMAVVISLERSLEKAFPKDFKDKLVQLPEMMGVYNSLAQQMIQTTGSINSNQLAGFVGGIQQGFGVEGINLQRYASGLFGGFRGSQNAYLRKMQFAALRQTDPNIDYNEAMITLQNPTSNPQYMRNYARLMRSQGTTQYARWYESMGLGWEEAMRDFKSGNIEKAIEAMGKINKDKTSPESDFKSFADQAKSYYSAAELHSKEISDNVKIIQQTLSSAYQRYFDSGTSKNIGMLGNPATSGFAFMKLMGLLDQK